MAADDKKYQEMKEQIDQFMRKKDYYDILGVQKDCNQAQVKKAYKRLALRFHPDKNQTEGSKEVFKKVSNAYSVLIDLEKRAHYDHFGPEQDRVHQPQYRTNRAYHTEQQYFQDIFRSFFNPHQQGTTHFRHYQFQAGGNPQQNKFNMIYVLVFIAIVYIGPLLLPKETPLYSNQPSSTFRYSMKTKILNVGFYVRQQYYQESTSQQTRLDIEKKIDLQYLMELNKLCDMEKWRSRGQYRKKNGDSCWKLHHLQQTHQEYIRDLFY